MREVSSQDRLDCSDRPELSGSRSVRERLGMEFAGRSAAVGAVFKQIARLTIENFADLAKRIEAHAAGPYPT